jgi:predicted ester cyclase
VSATDVGGAGQPPLLERALALWGHPLPAGPAALDAFRSVYTDPVELNGEAVPVAALVERAAMMQAAIADLRHTVLEQVHTPGRLAFAFRISGRLVGPLTTPIGVLAATGGPVDVMGMDIFVLDEVQQRVRAVWALADHLSLLVATGVVDRLPPAAAGPAGPVG